MIFVEILTGVSDLTVGVFPSLSGAGSKVGVPIARSSAVVASVAALFSNENFQYLKGVIQS